MTGWLTAFTMGVVSPPGASLFWVALLRMLGFRGSFCAGWIGAIAGTGTVALLQPDWAEICGLAVSTVIAVAVWWWRRRKDRRKALAAMGAKARARIAAMRQAMRERARPRPVLKPGLQGAR